MAERDLERELAELAVAWPSTPALADAVLARLQDAGRSSARSSRLATRPLRRPIPHFWPTAIGRRRRALIPAVAALLIAGAATMGFSADARSAVLEWLGLRSVKIERREPPPAPPGSSLALGRRLSLDRARAAVDFAVRVPSALGAPDAVYLSEGEGSGPRVAFAYSGRVPVLVQQLEATAGPLIQKSAGAATRVQRLSVDRAPAYFLTGAHGFAFLDSRGDAVYETQRLAGNTLLVEQGRILVRIEGAVSRRQAVRFARSLE